MLIIVLFPVLMEGSTKRNSAIALFNSKFIAISPLQVLLALAWFTMIWKATSFLMQLCSSLAVLWSALWCLFKSC